MKRNEKILKRIGSVCQKHREHIGATQYDVAKDVGYSPLTISSFETGRTNNLIIFLWYLTHGLPLTIIKSLYRGDFNGD